MELIGDYYAEKILSRKDLIERELLGWVCWGGVELQQDLFGWKVHVGKDEFACRSETEARYLRVFLDLGWRKVSVPQDEKYLAEILPRLEYLKRRADEIIDSGLAAVFNRKLKDEVRRKFYRKISGTAVTQNPVEIGEAA